MMHYTNVVQEVSTVTVGPTGSADDMLAFGVVMTNQPFTNLSISVVPTEDNSPYRADVIFGDEVFESHDYTLPTSRTVALFSYSHFIFPANFSVLPGAKFDPTKVDPAGVEVGVRIGNYSTVTKTFRVYCCYEVFETPRFLNNVQPTT